MEDVATRFHARLREGPLVLDGATGTELERRGGDWALPLWSARALLERPDLVVAIHADYVAAGADIIVANTFRTNPRTLQGAGRAADGPKLAAAAVEHARRAAAGHDVFVAASVAPVEDCYCPERVPADDVLRAEHAQLATWLAAAAPDFVCIETMNTAREAGIAAEAIRAQGLPFSVSFVVDEGGNLLGGDTLEAGVVAVRPCDPLAIGLNCIPPRGLTGLLPRLRLATTKPLAAYAHIGNQVPIRGWTFAEEMTPEQYADAAGDWLALGVSVIGGCCGTTPAHIHAVSERVHARRRTNDRSRRDV